VSDKDFQKRKDDLISAMSKERGYMPPPWSYMVEKDFDFIETYNNLYIRSLGEGKSLPIKTRELIAIGILAFRGLTDGVYEHAKRAIQHGATKQELMEAIETTIIPGGAPTFATGLKALMMIEEDEKNRTIDN